MPKLRARTHGTVTSVVRLQRHPRLGRERDARDREPRPEGCISPGCTEDPLRTPPVALCPKHLREVYEFAQDYIAERWDGAVRDYVSGLHAKFRPPSAVRRKPGNVYFIQFGDRVKVGYSENPTMRLANLPHDEVIGVIPGSRADERAWHQLLAEYRVTGEWFQADPRVLAHIRKVCVAAAAETA